MKILHRYLASEFVKPFILCIFVFQFMFIVADCFNSLDDFIRNGSSLSLIVNYYIAMVPVTLTQTLPPAILIAVLYIMGDLNRNNEIIAMRSVGLSGLRILSPLIIFVNQTLFDRERKKRGLGNDCFV